MSLLNAFTISNIIILLISLVFMVYLYFKWSYTYWSRRGVITPPCCFPLGNLNDVAFGRVSLQEMYKQHYNTYKSQGIKWFGYYLIQQPVLVVIDLKLIKSIMVKDFSHFTDHGLLDEIDGDPFGESLFSLKGDKWKQMRVKLTPLFSSGKIKMMFSTIENCALQLTNLLDQAAEKSEKLNIKDIAGRYTTDITASVAFGIESNSLKDPNSDFKKYGDLALGHADTMGELRLVVQTLLPNLTKFFKIPTFSTEVSNFFHEIVKSTIKHREENNVVRKDFMQLMIQLKNNVDVAEKDDNDCFNLQINNNNNNTSEKNETKSSFSITNVVAQAMLFFLAGYDTASLTITYCMYELAFHQDLQEKVRDEIKAVLSKHEGNLTYNAIMEMPFMDKCIKETLRRYPLIATLFRRCTKTYQVPNSDLIIEKDTLVFIPANELHYDSEYFSNPEDFDPERFSTENISKRNTYTWLPFGEGPRICIGARLGMIQIKVALAMLLGDFRYSLDARTAYPIIKAPRSFLVSAVGGIWLNVEKILE